MIRLILDVACNRVIYFTKDRDISLTLNEHVYLRDWFDELPLGMCLENSWNFKLVKDRLVEDQPQPQERKSLFEHNKERILQFLYEKVNNFRKLYEPSCAEGHITRSIKLFEAKNNGGPLLEQMCKSQNLSIDEMSREIIFRHKTYLAAMTSSEIFREVFKEKILRASDNSDLYQIRDQIQDYKIDLTFDKSVSRNKGLEAEIFTAPESK